MNNVNSRPYSGNQPIPDFDSLDEEIKPIEEEKFSIKKVAEMVKVIATLGAVFGALQGIKNGEVIAGMVTGALGGAFLGTMAAIPQKKDGPSNVIIALFVIFIAGFGGK